jgi:hypothetical protein
MGLRERLNQNPGITTLVVIGLVVLALAGVVVQVLANRRGFSSKLPDAFYTVDDGKTFFVANTENVAPFDYKGQTAVHAYVYECDGKRFVGYMERYTPDARNKILAQKRTTLELETYGRELKIPGGEWIKASNTAAVAKIADIKCPDGRGTPQPVEP